MSIECIVPPETGRKFKAALFDFDGTLSLIREGWQGVMIPYFCEELNAAPGYISDGDSAAGSVTGALTYSANTWSMPANRSDVEPNTMVSVSSTATMRL